MSGQSSRTLLLLGDIRTKHVRAAFDEEDIPRFRPGLPAQAILRGDSEHTLPLKFVRTEPFVTPKHSLTGIGGERVDTRVLQVIYALEPGESELHVGQQVDVFVSLD